MTTALIGYYDQDVIRLRYVASVAPTALNARITYEFASDPGKPFTENVPEVTSFTVDRTFILTEGESSGGGGGVGCNVTGGGVLITGGTVKRGQFYVRFVIARSGSAYEECLCCGYVYDTKPFLTIGEHTESGPGGGEGFLSWVSLAANIAPVDVTEVLATPNTTRKIHGFVWYYNVSADAASRTLDVKLRAMGLATPTGFTATTGVFWATSTRTLVASDEGLVAAYNPGRGDGRTAYNTNGTLAQDDSGTTPNPFPLWIEENDLAELFFDVGSASVNDRHSIYLLREEWLVI